jgi:hypothetical protein
VANSLLMQVMARFRWGDFTNTWSDGMIRGRMKTNRSDTVGVYIILHVMRKTIYMLTKWLFAWWCCAFRAIVVLQIPYRPIVIKSETLMTAISYISRWSWSLAKAAAFFPVAILRYDNHQMNETRIRHETIHHYQQIETMWLCDIYNWWEYILWYSKMDTYLYRHTEQEAYLHQDDPTYLSTRPRFARWSYIWDKKRFRLEGGRVTLD